MEVNQEHKLDDGTVIRLLHADADHGSGMRRGTCPRCGNGMEGFVGDSGAMVELDADGVHGEPHLRRYVGSTNWGHESCVALTYNELIDKIESNVDVELPWTASTQREMILFLQDNGSIEATYDRARPAASRYHFRRKVGE